MILSILIALAASIIGVCIIRFECLIYAWSVSESKITLGEYVKSFIVFFILGLFISSFVSVSYYFTNDTNEYLISYNSEHYEILDYDICYNEKLDLERDVVILYKLNDSDEIKQVTLDSDDVTYVIDNESSLIIKTKIINGGWFYGYGERVIVKYSATISL